VDALIDEVLETLTHSATWRSISHLSLTTLIVVAVIAFLILAYRRSKPSKSSRSRRGSFRYRSHYLSRWSKKRD